MTDVTTIVMFT